jgi:ubiquitin-like 1-activating enzyme E1 B
MLMHDPEMAGNIIPAIATTNAMTASLSVLQSYQLLRSANNQKPEPRMVYLSSSGDHVKRTTESGGLLPPNPECPTCSSAMGVVHIDFSQATLQDLVGLVKKSNDEGGLGYGESDFSILSEAGIVYDSLDEDMEDMLEKKLSEMGIVEHTVISVRDEDEDENGMLRAQVDLYTAPSAKDEEQNQNGSTPVRSVVSLQSTIAIPRRRKTSSLPLMPKESNGVNGTTSTNGENKGKRKADEAELEEGGMTKKGKMDVKEIVVLEDDDGAIVLD